jgi:hemerythrin-like domain-containing protein
VKRHEALIELSRDHHQALSRALRLRRATAEDAAEVGEDVIAFWRQHGSHHFAVEEEVLLPRCADRIDPRDEAVVTVLTDHVWIRSRMERLAGGDLDLDAMHALGERLDAHVRHEERVLFPLIEEALPEDELTALAAAVAAAE